MTRRERLARALAAAENGFAKVADEDLRWALTQLTDDGSDAENAPTPPGDPCPDCDGPGSLVDGVACQTCGGTGRV